MSTERDTHFQGFAKMLWDEIDSQFPDSIHTEMFYAIDNFEDRIVQLIAQRAFDLARHAIDCTAGGYYASHYLSEGQDMADVPDITAWTEQNQ